MIPCTLFTLVAILSSLAAVNGGVAQRDGSFHIRQANPATTTSTSTSHPSSTSATQSTTASTTPSTTATSVTTTSTLTLTSTSTSSTNSVTSIPSSTPSSSVTSAPSTSPTITATIPVSKPPTTTISATATSTAVPGACNGVQNWQAAFAYTAGDQVIFNGQLFKARQWTYNNAPPTHPDQWIAVGTCTQPINNQANCNGVAAWQSTDAYTTGNRVTFQGHLWSAVQWSESNAPGDASGSWKDLGACA